MPKIVEGKIVAKGMKFAIAASRFRIRVKYMATPSEAPCAPMSGVTTSTNAAPYETTGAPGTRMDGMTIISIANTVAQ